MRWLELKLELLNRKQVSGLEFTFPYHPYKYVLRPYSGGYQLYNLNERKVVAEYKTAKLAMLRIKQMEKSGKIPGESVYSR